MWMQFREAAAQHELAKAALAVAHLGHARWQTAVAGSNVVGGGGGGAAAGLTPSELQTLLKAGQLQVRNLTTAGATPQRSSSCCPFAHQFT